MPSTYRVRYRLKPAGAHAAGLDVQTVDVQTDLDHCLEALPSGAYVMSIEELTASRDVHWSRWPKSNRPGFGG